jgi:hypothetical protein
LLAALSEKIFFSGLPGTTWYVLRSLRASRLSRSIN